MLTDVRSREVARARRLGKRGLRWSDRRFLVEGPQGVREALRRPRAGSGAPALLEVYLTEEANRRHPDLAESAGNAGVPVWLCSAAVLEALAATVHPQGVLGVAPMLHVPAQDWLSSASRLVVVLAAVRDPGNAGTIVRTADAAGADGVIFSPDSVDCYNPKCVRASAGSVFHLPLTLDMPVPAAATALHAAGLQVLAADARAGADLDTLAERGRLAEPTAWLFGNEAWGLPGGLAALADEAVRIPIHGDAESLNLASAAAVCLYASATAQRRDARG